MINELKNTELVNKVGGRFKLTALIQKRLEELINGSRPLIEDTEGKTNLEIVVQEIKEDKIVIDTQTDEIKEQEAIQAAEMAVNARIKFWDGVLEEINKIQVNENISHG